MVSLDSIRRSYLVITIIYTVKGNRTSRSSLDPMFSAKCKVLRNLKKGDSGPANLDMAIIIPVEKFTGLPYIEIKNGNQQKLYDDIIISGYPGAINSLSLDVVVGLRFSPVIQFWKDNRIYSCRQFSQILGAYKLM